LKSIKYSNSAAKSNKLKLMHLVLALLMLICLTFTLLSCGLFNFDDNSSTIDSTESIDLSDLNIKFNLVDEPVPPNSPIVMVVEAIHSSVVEITVSSYSSSSSGSGVIVAEDETYSYILTCFHVVENASRNGIKVTLTNDSKYTATYVGGDYAEDIALLRIKATNLNIASTRNVGNSPIKLGEDVIVIGNPLGTLGGTVTRGIIGGLAREISVSGFTLTVLQTDASINSGNSGGGMFDSSGLLIGIINAKSAATNTEGLGFAIPIEIALQVVEKLLA
jgi:serine protease Do